jgi:predicted GNAT family N-acyltransferase
MVNPTQPVIRAATPDDVYAIRAFHAQSWLDTYPNDNAGVPEEWVREKWQDWDREDKLAESRQRVEEFLSDKDQLYQVAVIGDEVVALLHASRHAESQDLGALYVAKSYLGSGLAQRLMQIANDFWDSDRPVELAVVDYNDRAKRFYEKQGFRKVPGSDYLHADTMPSIRMRRSATQNVKDSKGDADEVQS